MKKLLRGVTICALAVFTMTTSSVYANDQQGIPSDVQELADSKVSQKQPIPEIRAWEIDLNGNKKEVVPLSQRGDFSVLSPPNDGYVYSFYDYNPDYVKRDWRYKNLGTFRYVNSTDAKASIQYEQQTSTTGSWSVGANISGTASAKVAFLGKISVEVGGEWNTSRQWYSGRKYGATQEVLPRTTIYLTNYQVAANSNGKLRWKKYAPGGTSLIGMYEETAGGYAVSMSDINIEVTKTEPTS